MKFDNDAYNRLFHPDDEPVNDPVIKNDPQVTESAVEEPAAEPAEEPADENEIDQGGEDDVT